ncbi:MAG: hypothetical protein RMN52_09505 [Anaerolineae bacterium]|nr:hypothetical protein [Candidatus Roseilinea sp.]MDW8450229.1 hypothetical protein [Anaerolineae bacterium]
MKAVIYTVELLTPALLGRVEGDPNSSVSYDYIPGGVVRGALVGRFAREHRVPQADILDDAKVGSDARRLFFGAARFLNAYPADRLNNRALPTPRSWQRDKSKLRQAMDEREEHAVPIYDFALEARDDAQYVRVGAPFCWVSEDGQGSTARLVSPRRRVMVHTQRAAKNRNFGRPRDDDGAVYRYESLDAGQTFIGVVLCDDADAETFKALLTGEHWIGKAHTSGYGRACFAVKRVDDHWRDAPGSPTASDGRLLVTLTSPLLLCDERGQFVVSPRTLAERIARALGVEAALEGAFVGQEVVGAFNRKWGLPLPQAPAFSPGSTLVLKLRGGVSTEQMRRLEDEGMGERRIDGFGRLVFNWQKDEMLRVEMPPKEDDGKPTQTITSDAGKKIAQRMAQRSFERQLESILLSHAAKLQVDSSLSRAQLYRLRSIALNAAREGKDGTQRLQSFIESVSKRQTTHERWERARIEIEPNVKRPLLDWIRGLTDAMNKQTSEWCKAVGLKQSDLPRAQIGDVSVEFGVERQREFTLRLLAEVLRLAAKQSKQRGGE